MKILLLDIETAPSLGWYFDLWKEGNIVGTKSDWYILCYAYKWLDEKKIHTVGLPDFAHYKKDKEDDWKLAESLHKLFDEADVIVAHNGDSFDIKKSNARFIAHGLRPPSPYKTVDTLKIARRHFKFDSNKLNELGKYLGVGGKLPHTGFHTWKGAMTGDKAAWKLMRKYNARDVELLEAVYLKLRAWSTAHVNLNLYTDGERCPRCQSTRISKRGQSRTLSAIYTRYCCLNCGHWSRDTGERADRITIR